MSSHEESFQSDDEVELQSHSTNPSTPSQTSSTSIYDCPSTMLKEFAKGPYNEKKPLLQFVTNLDAGKKIFGGTRNWLCHFCNTKFQGSYTRVESHLLDKSGTGVRSCKGMNRLQVVEACRMVQDVKVKNLGSSLLGQTSRTRSEHVHTSSEQTQTSNIPPLPSKKRAITDMLNVQAVEEADDAIDLMFYAHGLPFHLANSPYVKDAFKKYAKAGPSYQFPSYHKLRTTHLDKHYAKCNLDKERMMDTWLRFGCSIIMDGWTDRRHRPLLNIIVSSRSGPYFLRAIDASGEKKDAEYMYLKLKEAIDEIGAGNVVQVITDGAPVCKKAGQMIQNNYKHIFWTPCCVHALNNTLKDIGKIPWVKDLVSEAREMQMFICNRHTSLAIFRSFSKKEFIKPGDTRYATFFILLERMIEVQEALQTMVVCTEWKRWDDSKTEEGKRIRDQILNERWWNDAKYIVSFISPIVSVIRYADTDAPNLGEIYETFDSMLGEMKRVICEKDSSFYERHIRPIVQKRWDNMNTLLHMAAYAVNPKWYEPRLGRVPPYEDTEVRKGFLASLDKMYAMEEASRVRDEWLKFVTLSGPFNNPNAIHDRATIAQRDPIGWWMLYGDDTPNLRFLAIRLLSQVASSSAAERNWSTYGFVHSLRRNKLTSRRAEKLVAVHSSLRLRDRVRPEYKASPAARWDVDVEDMTQYEDDEDQQDLVGIPLQDVALDDDSGSSESDEDIDSDHDVDREALFHEPIGS